jgi:hypothetical protein
MMNDITLPDGKRRMRFSIRSLLVVIILIAIEAGLVAAARRDANYREWVIGFSFLLLYAPVIYLCAKLAARRQEAAAMILLMGAFPLLLGLFVSLLLPLMASE